MKEIRKEAQEIQAFLEITCSDDPSEMIERLSTINAYMARSGKLLADAKLIQEKAVNATYRAEFKQIGRLPPSIAKHYVTNATTEENHLVNWLDRINRTCTHQGENLRTQISFMKQQLELE